MKKQIIKFIPTLNMEIDYYPKPAKSKVPIWYKEIKPYVENVAGYTGNDNNLHYVDSGSIKKCMPVFDAITSGYLIFSQIDIRVSQQESKPYYEWSMNKPIDFHPQIQATNHPYVKYEGDVAKFLSFCGIKTPPGYSCFFTSPMHEEIPFKIFEGVVDTDNYHGAVNFPFVLKDPNWEGIIPAGTPIAQVIPFKRTEWKMELGNEDDLIKVFKQELSLRSTFFNNYKKRWWVKKSYE